MGRAADFFVSYTSADRAWAEWIAWQLEADGYQVVVQAWDFGPGRDWSHEMHRGTSTAGRVVVVLSPAYLESAHGEAEWRVFYAEDPSGERRLLLPVRVGEVDPPGLLKGRVYVDLVRQDEAGARRALLAAARGERAKPAGAPRFPGGRGASVSAIEAPRFPSELPPTWNVPYHANPFFTGRESLLSAMEARLAGRASSRRVVLTGLGGVGKTLLAVEYAYRRRADYDLVWWIRGELPASLLGDYAALADQPSLALDLRLRDDVRQEAVVAAVRRWLEHHGRWLLVFDNLEEPQAVANLLPQSATGHVLLTSQAETGWELLVDPLPVDVLSSTDAAAFLLARTGQEGPHAEAASLALAGTLRGLPLALEQAAAYVNAAGTVSLEDYVDLFATRAVELLRRGRPLGYRETVATTWSLALQRLKQTEPAGVGLLTLAAFLAPDDLPQPLIAGHADRLPQPLARAARDPMALGDAVAALRQYSLVRVIGDGLFVHPLLQAVVRAWLKTTTAERAWGGAAVQLLRASFPSSSDEVENWAECQRLLPHVLTATEHSQRLDIEPEQTRWLLKQAATYLRTIGRLDQSRALTERIVASAENDLGPEHAETLAWTDILGQIRQAMGELRGTAVTMVQSVNLCQGRPER